MKHDQLPRVVRFLFGYLAHEEWRPRRIEAEPMGRFCFVPSGRRDALTAARFDSLSHCSHAFDNLVEDRLVFLERIVESEPLTDDGILLPNFLPTRREVQCSVCVVSSHAGEHEEFLEPLRRRSERLIRVCEKQVEKVTEKALR